MSTQWAVPGANALLAGATFPTTFYVARHTGDPGNAGTANAAADTRRIEITTDVLLTPEDGVVGNVAYAEILNATTDENITHISIWDSTSAGVCYFIAALTGGTLEVLTGETVGIAAEQLRISLPIWGS